MTILFVFTFFADSSSFDFLLLLATIVNNMSSQDNQHKHWNATHSYNIFVQLLNFVVDLRFIEHEAFDFFILGLLLKRFGIHIQSTLHNLRIVGNNFVYYSSFGDRRDFTNFTYLAIHGEIRCGACCFLQFCTLDNRCE